LHHNHCVLVHIIIIYYIQEAHQLEYLQQFVYPLIMTDIMTASCLDCNMRESIVIASCRPRHDIDHNTTQVILTESVLITV
jgi:hypothetical protein